MRQIDATDCFVYIRVLLGCRKIAHLPTSEQGVGAKVKGSHGSSLDWASHDSQPSEARRTLCRAWLFNQGLQLLAKPEG